MRRRGSRSHVGAMVLRVSVCLWLSAGATAGALTNAPSPTRTPTACGTFPPPTLTFGFSAEPAHPVVGDQVQLSFSVSGGGGLPAYSLSGATPASPPFSVEVVERASGPTPTSTSVATLNECDPSANNCPDGKECLCCCGTWVCMPPYLPCCALPCSSPTLPPFTPTPTPTCHSVVGLTDCQADSDCVVVDQIDCCPCSSGGQQAAINGSKQAELSQQLEVCCAVAGVCLEVYQCQKDLEAICDGGTCRLVSTTGTPSPTPTPTRPNGTCIDDCNGDGAVTIDELILGVNIVLGSADASACPSFDCCGDLRSCIPDITCIIRAVGYALDGCGGTLPTPTPSDCRSAPCGGDCVICPPCTSGGICNGALCQVGVCQADAAGTCQCVPVQTPTPTPTPTPVSPQCSSVPCGGSCTICPPCSPDTICPLASCWLGACQPDDAGVCQCVPVQAPTPTPQCSGVPCGGSCTISAPCTPGPNTVCPDFVVLGECQLDPLNGCQCQPAQPVTPTPAPTPVLYHGHTCCACADAACADFAWVEVEPVCPLGCQTFTDAECEAPCHGGPVSGPATCASLTPCTTDADCDDGNGCTADRCTIDGCTHQCVCD
jgi:hypothetical protein